MISTLIEIAKNAGDIVLKYFKGTYNTTIKGDKHVLVTTADKESEKYIVGALHQKFPTYSILSEEQENTNINNSKNVFIVDPLDGTRQFTQGIDTFSIMIGLCKNGTPVAGVIYAPARGELFYGEKGKGAYLKIKNTTVKLVVSDTTSLDTARVFEKEPHHSGKQSELLAKLPSQYILLNSATGYKICSIASGKADIFINTSSRTSSWDVCAAQIILEEAGGIICDFSGKPLSYLKNNEEINRLFFATTYNLSQKILDLIK